MISSGATRRLCLANVMCGVMMTLGLMMRVLTVMLHGVTIIPRLAFLAVVRRVSVSVKVKLRRVTLGVGATMNDLLTSLRCRLLLGRVLRLVWSSTSLVTRVTAFFLRLLA